ncbi:alpha/beta hydrolase family protein [Maribacter ulvicola]|uniref:Dienelactone hydrolase n=1 Tax=Maribacter ulvicola TaxID=228959 RepID=A0A1N6RBX5_9FLAO|nr:hypothetical protein [Maribacter ulvicola]SIQ26317.1 Dienelactone hydrolase [Maribacter ulvicola]
MKKIYNQTLKWIHTLLRTITPGKNATRGASFGLLTVSIILWVIYSIHIYLKLNDPWILLLSLLLVFLSIFFALALRWGLRVLNKVPPYYQLAVCIASPLLIIMGFTWITPAIIFVLSSLCGAAIFVLLRSKFQNLSNIKKLITAFGILFSFGGLIGLGILYFYDGFDKNQLTNQAKSPKSNISPINAISPSTKGAYSVQKITYGSGKDLNRLEFGSEVDMITESVNGIAFTDKWTGFGGWWRKRHFGFDSKSLPINARVWYPEGKGPFPLALIVHGNHDMQDYSDSGYGYLGELLASKGIILASVDQNFLNESWSNSTGGLNKENDARAWLLLEHLKVWHKWNKTNDHLFYQKIDTSNIALMGHSRGGEAVAHAAMFNQLPFYPDDATIPFNYNYNIKSIVAIAPVDGQYEPAGSRTELKDIDYFTLHGSQDADVSSYMGSQQYERITFKDSLYHFKSGLYIYGANHGQFNESWGKNDTDNPFIGLFNLQPLLSAKNQQKIAKVYISAFLDITLKNKKEYLPLFVDARKGKAWLPETIYLNQFEDSNLQTLTNFDEDFDVSTTTLSNGSIYTKNLSIWREQEIKLNWQKKGSRALFLGWDYNDKNQTSPFESVPDSLIASYNIDFSSIPIDSSSVLVFSMAESKKSSPQKSKEKMTRKGNILDGNRTTNDKNKTSGNESIDFTIQLSDADDHKISFPISEFSPLQNEIRVMLMKTDLLRNNYQSEKVFQTFYFPIKEFQSYNSKLDLSKIERVKFIFDKNETGGVIIDNIGFMKVL